MKILLIGNLGQVGREITELAAAKNFLVAGFDLNTLDITRRDQVFAVVNQHSDCDVLINAAAYTAVDKAEDEPGIAYAVNCDGVENLALACSEYNIPLLHISTDYVFSGDKKMAYTENSMPDPVSFYGKSKLAGEQILASAWHKHIILRTSWVFSKHGGNFVKTILKLAQEREELKIVGDQHGCPTPAADVARVLLEMAQKITAGAENFGIYNYCGLPATNWHEFAKQIIELGKSKYQFKLKKLQKITTPEYPTKAVRPLNSELEVQKIIQDYGIQRHEWLGYLQEVIENLN
jgi:dTDP-4-dehydrorhamnose reductase